MNKVLVSKSNFWENIPEDIKSNYGIYKIQCFDDKLEKIIKIPRVLELDEDGILYIGKTTLFSRRINFLIRSLNPNTLGQSHICGRRYNNEFNINIRKRFPFERLCITLIQDDNPDEREKEELKKYAIRFGVPPVLNRF
ncbi:MAG: hypothetical protein DWP97_13555 [Calditrichaeota bacterium]|nr:MAG: hypothetical protein DWP97_13555 [Calditrichota bacterium]